MKKNSFGGFLKSSLKKLKEKKLYRETQTINPGLINFASNDYLGLSSENPEIQGSGGSRLISGTHEIHEKLEKFLAEIKDKDAALVFGSGYLANLGTLSALLGSRDVVFSDEFNHSCILDGIRLSGAKKFIFKHNNLEHLETLLKKHRSNYQLAFIATEAVFSMDGDKGALIGLDRLCRDYNCVLYIDEAHATGVIDLKETYKKLSPETIIMGTFSKAIGLEGGYICGSQDLISFLTNKARTFIYSTAASPSVMEQVLKNLKIIYEKKERKEKLKKNIKYFREALLRIEGIEFTNQDTAIFGIFLSQNPKEAIDIVLKASEKLKKTGFFVQAIRPPTVNLARLRICISSKHSLEELNKLIAALQKIILK
jgi:8-amino-7-oxononanoate synthase